MKHLSADGHASGGAAPRQPWAPRAPHVSSHDEFEWPPPEDALNRQVFWPLDRMDESRQPEVVFPDESIPQQPADDPDAVAGAFVPETPPEEDAAPEEATEPAVLQLKDEPEAPWAVDPPLQQLLDEPHTEPHIALRREIESRAAAHDGHEASRPRGPIPSRPIFAVPTMPVMRAWVRSRALPIALAVVALIAVVQAAFIVRTLWGRSAGAPGASAQGPLASAAAPQAKETGVRESGSLGPPVVPRGSRSPATPPRQPATSTRTGTDAATGTTGATSRSRGAPATGRLVIRSDPSGAQVSIDGRRYGVTPITLADVKPGEHRIILEREGAEVRQTVRVDAGATVTVVAPLGPSGPVSGWIAVASPVELDVFEEGALLGTSRSSQIMLAAGPHTLQLVNTRLGFRREQQVRVDPGRSVQIPVELPRVLVNVNATPWAEVWIDGKHVGQTPLARVPVVIGTHEVVFRHPELGEKTVTALIRADVPNRLTADLRQQSR